WCERRDGASEHEARAFGRARVAFGGVAAVGDGGGTIEAVVEEALIGVDLHLRGKVPVGRADHAFARHDRVAHDAVRQGHLYLAHVLIGEPASTLGSSPRACFAGTCARRWPGISATTGCR